MLVVISNEFLGRKKFISSLVLEKMMSMSVSRLFYWMMFLML